MATSVTSLRNPIDELTSKLSQEPTKPVGTLEQEFGAMAQRGARAREITPEILSQTQQAERDVIEPIMRKRESRAAESKQMFERQAEETAGMEQKYAAMRPEPIEFAPSKETSENLQNIAISMMLVGAIAGGASKRSGIAGLKAMKGMVDGYRQGRKDIFDKEKTIFEKALETQKQKIEEIKSLYESEARARLAGNQAEANGLKAMIEAETANGTLNIALAQRNTDQVLNQLKAASEGYNKGLEGLANLKKAEEDRKARLEQARLSKEMALANSLAIESVRQEGRLGLEEIRAGRRMGTAGPRYEIQQATGKTLPTDKLALDVINTGQGLLEVSKLRDRLRDPEIQTGLRAVPAPIVTKLRSLVGRETTEGDIMSVVNSPELSGSDKTTLFIKDAILAAFKIEQGLTGTRVPVFTQRTIGPILDPRAYSPETYDKLLETRQKELFGRGRDYGFDQDEMSVIARVRGMPGTTKDTGKPALKDQDQEALNWANANPNDPRSAEIKKRLGVR